MSILVTGGAGFIGSHLCRRLVAAGKEVVCLDNLYTGTVENISDLMGHGKFRFINKNVFEPCSLKKISRIYHLACPASPVHYQRDPIFTLKTCFNGTLNMLELARCTGATILLASTSEVYGDPLIHPQKEDYRGNVSITGPRSCYDEGKRVAESLMMNYHMNAGIDIRIVRIFNTYGPGMGLGDGRVISNFFAQSLQNQDITIYGNGMQTRSFCYVDDMVDALMLMMENRGFLGAVNLGNPDEITILELAHKIIKISSSQSSLVFKDLPVDDPLRRKPDVSLARQKLNWQPKTSIDDGLRICLHYFTRVLGNKASVHS
jgi:UDP-glucuronate decarboxylase